MNSGSSAKDIFLDAIEVKPEAREEYIGRSCGGNDALIAEVRALIREHDDACAFLRKPTVAAAAIAGETTGTVIGRYRLLGRLGEGGFGTVFMAEQRDPVVRLVALKIIKAGMDTRHVIARFEAERQALALMDHPNIAKVLDAGATEQGRPYFVMELVSGEPITTYCAGRGLALRDRIEILTQVCLAVQHAHSKGVIHRDIKPGNILVSEQDGRPIARVIDFGVAKATDRRVAEQTAFTEHRHFIGTPEYMSPEQAAGSADIDTRTDVYSLGVLLYELLTGCTPFDSRTLRAAAYGEIQRIILEEEPLRPSTRLSRTGGQASPETAAPEKLSRTVRGELDWIVMKSLEKDRARRYPTAIALGDDLRRFLDGSPVEAAPPGASYRVAKFVRRHRAVVVGAAVIGGALASGLGAAVYGLGEAREQRDAARLAQNLEKEERLSAEVITGFMQNMFEAVNPSVARGRDTGVLREMVDAAAKRVEHGELKESPAAEAVLRIRLASVYLSLSQADSAERLLLPVDQMLHASRPGDRVWREKLLSERISLAGIRRNFDEKIRLGEELVELRRKQHGDDHPDVANALSTVVMGYFEKGSLDEAKTRALVALAAAERAGHGLTTGTLLNQLMAIEQARNDVPLAAQYGERSVTALKTHLKGEDHPLLARTLTTLVAVKGLIPGEEAATIATQREAIAMFRRLYPEGTPDLGTAINNLAWLLKAQNKLDEAEQAYMEALTLERSLGSDREFSAAQVLINLGQLEMARGNLAKAEQWTREALESCARAYPKGHYITGFAFIDLGRVLRETDRLEESIGAYREALALHRRILGVKHPYCAISLNGIGEAHVRLNRHEAAVEPFRELLDIRKADKPEDPIAAAQLQLAMALSGTGHLKDAKEAVLLARAAVENRERLLKSDDWRIANSRSVAGGALLAEARLGPGADRLGTAREAYTMLVGSGEELYQSREKIPAPARKPLFGAACSRVISAIELLQGLDPGATMAETLEVWAQRRLDIDAR